jgi:hypothetical protein
VPTGLAERFWRLFEGAAKSHGTHGVPTGSGSKQEIRASARTIKEPVTEDAWRSHLAGTRPLGIVTIREDDSCLWAAVDVDDYTVDHADLAAALRDNKVPALVCKTKSGGAHVYIFFSEAIPAERVVPRMRELAALLGRGTSEIFPKQVKFPRGTDEYGSWLNMPYFGGDEGNRFCVRPDGRGMSMEAFLDAAERAAITPAQLAALDLHPRVDEFASGPPCLETLAAAGFQKGSLNNGMLAMATFAKKAHPDDWEIVLAEWNQRLFNPPLPADVLRDITKRMRRKDYNYRCKDQPICSHCNPTLCRTRPHGVGDGEAADDVEALEEMEVVLTDPETYYVRLRGSEGRVQVYAEQLLDMRAFQLAAARQLQRILPDYSRPSWRAALQRLFDNRKETKVSADAGPNGRFLEVVDRYVTQRWRAETKDEILLGKPWRDEAEGAVLFTLAGLEQEMDLNSFATGVPAASERAWVTERLRKLGGCSKQMKVKGVNRNVWRLPDSLFSWEVPVLDLPAHDDSPL